MNKNVYIAIDLKSFYASVECVDRGLDPLLTNLVVADESRTSKTICLAVSPSLKAYGISGRARLFEVLSAVDKINENRRQKLNTQFKGESSDALLLASNPSLKLAFIVAQPRMRRYVEMSSEIFRIYLRKISPEDIYSYSIDEVFIDATKYLSMYNCTAEEFASMLVKDVQSETGITATAGIGTNLYLAKVAMDILAKHSAADANGVRMAFLDEKKYRQQMWSHTPLTDFWRMGHGYTNRLAKLGIHTMGEIAACSIRDDAQFPNAKTLFGEFGTNAQLIIDHAWGAESITMQEIKAYRPKSRSLSSGQVLSKPYDFSSAQIIVREMAESLSLDMVRKCIMTKQLTLTIGYDSENAKWKSGEIKADHYGRPVPKHSHGSINLNEYTSSTEVIIDAIITLYNKIVNSLFSIRHINVCAAGIINESEKPADETYSQLDLFSNYEAENEFQNKKNEQRKKERKRQKVIIEIQDKYGKNAILKGYNFVEGATAIQRNAQIGGHKA